MASRRGVVFACAAPRCPGAERSIAWTQRGDMWMQSAQAADEPTFTYRPDDVDERFAAAGTGTWTFTCPRCSRSYTVRSERVREWHAAGVRTGRPVAVPLFAFTAGTWSPGGTAQ